ncbi:MAG: glycosyltransferase family 39 protein [Singulisphaera sp.]
MKIAMLTRMRATWQEFLSAAAPLDYANHLAAPTAARDQRAPNLRLLVLLVLACLVPRAIMAWRIDTVCADGVIYFHLAGELEAGRPDPDDVSHLQSGTFPLVLSALHRSGLTWENASKFYGVLAATLAVLPLFGWARRQFDERVAVLACLLYATHPKLIEWSPEAVREPSFWLFFLLALYFLWRAAAEVDWRLYLLAGAATALTVLTRFEGWFLLIPCCGWTLVRFWHLSALRWKLAGSALCGLLVIPVVFYGFGLLLPQGGDWSHVRLDPVKRAGNWLLSWRQAPPPPPVDAGTAAPTIASAPLTAAEITDPGRAAQWTMAEAAATMLSVCERGLTPLFAILMCAGFLTHWRLFLRSDNLPLLLVALAVVTAIWIHLWFAHQASSRYMLTIVLVATPSAALGLLDFGRLAEAWLARRWPQIRVAATTSALALVALVGTVDAVSSDFKSREALAGLGQWIFAQYGRSSIVVGSESQLAVVGFYAQGEAIPFPGTLSGPALAAWLDEIDPDVVVISKRRQQPGDYEAILAQRGQLGLQLIPAEQIPTSTKNMIVLVRERQPANFSDQTTSVPIEHR